jgi:AhpD family alkylhydroperoxidase
MSEHTNTTPSNGQRHRSRFPLASTWPEGYQALGSLHMAVAGSGLETSLLNLIFLRASQINGCGYCVDMHSKDLRADGEPEQRVHLVAAWQEAPVYTDRERAALALTEAATLVHQTHIPDDVYDAAGAHFTEEELAKLLFAIATINAWNVVSIGSRLAVGGYQPAKPKAATTS